MSKSLSSDPIAAPSPLVRFQMRLEEAAPEPAHLQPLLRELEVAGQLEAALRALKARHPKLSQEKGHGWGAIRVRMEVVVAKSRDRRMAQWQQDPRKRLLRLRFEVRGAATQLNPGALSAALAKAFLEAGLPIAMGLEKSPRPVLHLGHPLPLTVEGRLEWADATLREPLSIPMKALPALLNHHLPEGLRVLAGEEVPTISTPVLELCVLGHWSWTCPDERLAEARRRIADFLAAERFEIEKSGKVGGRKMVKRVDVRFHVVEARWEARELCLTTHLAGGAALNPQKLLAGILDVEPTEITGLVRLEVVLARDPKLENQYRYETKLSNLYEDAVLLEEAPGLRVEEDSDDDTLVMGG